MLRILLAVLIAVEPTAAPGGHEIRVKLINASARRLRAIHVSPSGASSWGENLLGRGQEPERARRLAAEGLTATDRTETAVPGDCGLYDVRLVAENGVEFLLDGVNLCEDGDVLTVTDRELTFVKLEDGPADKSPR
jgi:hypothetical protein